MVVGRRVEREGGRGGTRGEEWLKLGEFRVMLFLASSVDAIHCCECLCVGLRRCAKCVCVCVCVRERERERERVLR